MLQPRFALISLLLASVAASAIEAQVRERAVRQVPMVLPGTTTSRFGDGTHTLASPMAGPTNLIASGTPAMASLRWAPTPGAIGYYVSRTDPAGATVKLTGNAIPDTTFEDLSGGVKPGIAYTYHVTATHPNGGAGTAEVSFTPPAAAVPAWVRLEGQGDARVLVWAPVPDATSYQIFESWTQPVYVPVFKDVYQADGTTYRVQSGWEVRYNYMTRSHVVAATQLSAPAGAAVLNHRFAVGAAYPPSGVTAPRDQWRSMVVP